MRDRVRARITWLATLVLLAVAVAGLLAGSPRSHDRAYAVEQRLRCPTCQSVSVADSPSDTAAAMRSTIRRQVDAGRSDEEILGYFQDRYGAWVLLDPPLRGRTLVVWALPVLAAAVAVLALRRLARRSAGASTPLSAAERKRVLEQGPVVAGEEEP